jgi:hypothetical protein
MSAQQAYRDAESVSNLSPKKSFFATHKLLGVALLLLAIGLALASYLYLRPNVVIDSIPPFVHHKTAAEIVWKTYTDSKAGFEFKYPEQLSTLYISTQTWPPTAKVSDGSFACTPTTQTSGPGKVVRKTSTTPIFCATSQAEGTAGTSYVTYSYATSSGSKLVTFDFVLGFVDCGVYIEPKMTSCVVEQKAFSVDNLVSQIFATFKITGQSLATGTVKGHATLISCTPETQGKTCFPPIRSFYKSYCYGSSHLKWKNCQNCENRFQWGLYNGSRSWSIWDRS